ncbi:MAG: 1-phosphofructokinase family hexose kinase [Actinomycetia bacterium]|nr:1-phosphofructokinase family hexose kinase [Actinomycetes bacterium]
MTVISVTLNPALDIGTTVDQVRPTAKLRCAPPLVEPGGGGVNVARVVQRLGADVRLVTPLGGGTGIRIAQALAAADIDLVAVPIAGETRQSFTVREVASQDEFRFVLPGPELDRAEWQAVIGAVVGGIGKGDWMVLSGSLPPGPPSDTYATLAEQVTQRGARVIVDCAGETLHSVLAGTYEVVKPNLRELAGVLGLPIDLERDQESAARRALELGHGRAVVVSLGPHGALLVERDGPATRVRPPAIQPVSTVGAGDSMVGGLALGLGRGQSLVEAVRLGVAAGTATALTPGTELCAPAAVERILSETRLEAVSPPG